MKPVLDRARYTGIFLMSPSTSGKWPLQAGFDFAENFTNFAPIKVKRLLLCRLFAFIGNHLQKNGRFLLISNL